MGISCVTCASTAISAPVSSGTKEKEAANAMPPKTSATAVNGTDSDGDNDGSGVGEKVDIRA